MRASLHDPLIHFAPDALHVYFHLCISSWSTRAPCNSPLQRVNPLAVCMHSVQLTGRLLTQPSHSFIFHGCFGPYTVLLGLLKQMASAHARLRARLMIECF